jgi:hypothetical protein
VDADRVLQGGATAGPDAATVNERLDRLEADVDQLYTSTQKLTAQQEEHKRRLDREVAHDAAR